MDKNSIYYEQVKLLIRMLPLVAQEKVFALKGGTAINLFIRDFPRLSVDIDLAYLPIDSRNEALVNARAALLSIANSVNAQPDVSAVLQDNKPDELRVVVTSSVATIKIEVSPVARGTLHRPSNMQISEFVEDEFGINEVLSPNWQVLGTKFDDEFKGMTREPIELATLEATRLELLNALRAKFTSKDKDFLLSFKCGEPDWALFDEIAAAELPAVKWKLINIQRLAKNEKKHQEQLEKLSSVLDEWLGD